MASLAAETLRSFVLAFVQVSGWLTRVRRVSRPLSSKIRQPRTHLHHLTANSRIKTTAIYLSYPEHGGLYRHWIRR
jgi:hypothetical protein